MSKSTSGHSSALQIHTTRSFTVSVLYGTANLTIARLYPSLRPYLPNSSTHLASKNAIITGGNSGIGLQIAKDLTRLGATVILGCRNMQKGQDAVDEILQLTPDAKGRVSVRQLDTSSMESVKKFAEGMSPTGHIDILVNNAGIGGLPPGSKGDVFTKEGNELFYATNFLGSFYLTYLLESKLADDARVIFTSSFGQYGGKVSSSFSTGPVKNKAEDGFHGLGTGEYSKVTTRYGMTKSMQCAFARVLQAKWDREAREEGRASRKIVHSFTPGYTSTAIFDKYEFANVWKEPIFAALKAFTVIATHVSEGAATGTWLACTDDEAVVGIGMGGGYWDRMVRRTSTADLFNQELLDRLWTRWEADAGVQWR